MSRLDREDIVKVADDSRLWAFLTALTKKDAATLKARFSRPILALDPGETTGVAIWNPKLDVPQIHLFQLNTKDLREAVPTVQEVLGYEEWEHIRYEDYRVYGHMTEQHAFASLHTPKLIGVIECLAVLGNVGTSFCLAMHAKTFWTDEKLKMCGLYNPGLKHARDAQRHLLRYLSEELA